MPFDPEAPVHRITTQVGTDAKKFFSQFTASKEMLEEMENFSHSPGEKDKRAKRKITSSNFHIKKNNNKIKYFTLS